MDSITPPQHSHTQLYIVVGLLVLFAILFFTFRAGNPPAVLIPSEDTTPLQLKRLFVTEDEIKRQEEALNDPSVIKTKELTKTQQTAQSKAFASEIKPSM